MRLSLHRRLCVTLIAGLVAVGGMVAINAPAAHADLQNPRQQFLRDSTAGLFLHWGERTSPQHTNCAQWESDVTSGGWSPNYWVSEAQKLHTQYLVLATFHSRLGYARPWPSAIPGSCRTNRDFLGELITAASAQNLKVILYMTDDPQWHNEGLSSGDWLNSAAYSSFKGHTVDLTTRDGFGEYSYDLFFEVMQRYPNLAGFWIDNDNQYWIDHNLYQQIYQQRPNYTISNNNEDTPVMDMISNEQKTGMTPSYDYPQAVYTAAPRLIEADFKLPSTGAWWYDGSNPTVDRKLTLGRLVTNVGSSVKALMAETAQVNGTFPSNQVSFNNFADGYLDPIWESLHGVEGGGYLYGGLKPGAWNNGARGVTTISKTNPNLHYIHVIDPPTSGTSLVLRDNGYDVSSVSNLRTGASVSFAQSGGNITLTGLSTWDLYDTVFKVQTSGRTGIYPPSSTTMSASASASGHAATAAADGNYLTYWDSNNTTPVSLTFDLGASKPVRYLGVNQREDSVSYARSDTEQSARIRDYTVATSPNGTTWTTVKTATLPSARGVALIDIPATTTRFVRLTVNSTWAASTDTTRFKRLRVDEAWIGSDYVGAGTPPTQTSYEGESATLSGAAVANACAACSGGQKVRFIGNNTSNFATLNGVTVATSGTYQLTVQATVGGTRSFSVSVNGGAAVQVAMTGPDFNTPVTATVAISLNAATNSLRFFNDTANAPDLDRITIS